jgi:hypothetical protein
VFGRGGDDVGLDASLAELDHDDFRLGLVVEDHQDRVEPSPRSRSTIANGDTSEGLPLPQARAK